MKWYLEALKKYTVFDGRSRRKEYWHFVLCNFIIGLILGLVEGALGLFPASDHSILSIIYGLTVLLPAWAVSVRRLHDTGRSGWWFLIVLVPIVGGIVFLVFVVQDSQTGDNCYGPNPKTA